MIFEIRPPNLAPVNLGGYFTGARMVGGGVLFTVAIRSELDRAAVSYVKYSRDCSQDVFTANESAADATSPLLE